MAANTTLTYAQEMSLGGKKSPLKKTHPVYSSSLNPEAREFNSQSTATCLTENTALFVEGNETVLLQTAQAMVYNPTKAKCQTRVHIVFDSGSQRSYVTDRIKKTLNIVSKGKRTMSIVTFRAAKGSCKTCELVEIGIEVCSGPALRLGAFAVPTICEPLALELSIDLLSHLKLTDPRDGSSRLTYSSDQITTGA